MYLSLPLPSSKRRTFTITTIDQFSDSKPLEIGVRVFKTATIKELVKETSRIHAEQYASSSTDEWIIAQWNGSKLEIFDDVNVRDCFSKQS